MPAAPIRTHQPNRSPLDCSAQQRGGRVCDGAAGPLRRCRIATRSVPVAENGVGASPRALLRLKRPRRTVRCCAKVDVAGRLVDERDRPISGATLQIDSRRLIPRRGLRGAPWRPLGTVTTRRDGRFVARVPSNPLARCASPTAHSRASRRRRISGCASARVCITAMRTRVSASCPAARSPRTSPASSSTVTTQEVGGEGRSLSTVRDRSYGSRTTRAASTSQRCGGRGSRNTLVRWLRRCRQGGEAQSVVERCARSSVWRIHCASASANCLQRRPW